MAARKQRTAAAGAAAAAAAPPFVPHVVTSRIEHPAVLEHLSALAALGLVRFTAVPVGGEGVVAVADVAAALCADTVLLTFMHSNNEVRGWRSTGWVALLHPVMPRPACLHGPEPSVV